MSEIKKILVIDDEKMLHTMLKSIFASYGFEVISAFTGEEGLVEAVAKKPDLVILDVLMPGIKGREVCKRLKADPVTRDIPVLFLTAKDSEEDVQAELEAGAVGHVTKPINSMALLRQVKKILGIN
ncbi:MAG: response regulator [Candidatus Omnitrophica bacterium]|nr:response regulator [Candidatus Omnitrophota bacterium]